jgi:hypothetical protein
MLNRLRYPTSSHFASANKTAPTHASAGKVIRYRLDLDDVGARHPDDGAISPGYDVEGSRGSFGAIVTLRRLGSVGGVASSGAEGTTDIDAACRLKGRQLDKATAVHELNSDDALDRRTSLERVNTKARAS